MNIKSFKLLFLSVVLYNISCKENKSLNQNLEFNTESLRSKAFISNQDNCDNFNCFQFVKNSDSFLLYNISLDNELLKFDLIQDTLVKIKLPFSKSNESTTFKIINNKLICLNNGIFYCYDLNSSKLDTLNKISLDKESYLIMNLYSNCCNFINDSTFFVQLGKKNTYNFIDTSIFTFFTTSGKTYKLCKYLDEFNLRYIHYLNYLAVSDGDTIININALDNKLIKNYLDEPLDTVLISDKELPVFDTTSMTDLSYIKKFSENDINSRLFLFPKSIILIRQEFTSNKWIHYLYLFDRNLSLRTKSVIGHDV
ncbi:MAG: hypothetical protein HOP11_06775, partial [Saprospiraceae bacterium]|nr:hypothetical protein [Saprospiraceae bacterium]